MTFRPTHFAPAGGLRTWEQPDPALPNGPAIAAALPIRVVRRYGAWTEVTCANGWTAWVDDRELAGATPLPTSRTGGFGLPATRSGRLTLAAAGVLMIATFLPWFSVGPVSATAWKVPLAFLVDDGASGAPWLAWGLLVLAALCALAAVRSPNSALLAVLPGIGALAAGLHVVQVSRIDGASLGNVGIGAWVAVAAGALAAAGPLLEARHGVVTPSVTPPWVSPSPTPSVPSSPSPSVPGSQTPWTPTHRVPATGMACYSAPDPATASGIRLDPWLEVQVIECRQGWSRVRCCNGWITWVDGRRLEVQPA